MTTGKSYSYADAGVSIAAGNTFVKAISSLVKATARPGADAEIGGFGAFFDPKAAGFNDPLLVAATDGVGTKLKLAIDTGRHDTVGIDLVAMCVNDLVVQGAEPLFFLDYFATGKLEQGVASAVVAGIAEGCRIAGCALIGGETAEMPGMYGAGDYDLAGFSVGAVERGQQLTGERVAQGDVLLGIASSGFHSNGYSLVRRIVADKGHALDAPAPFDTSRPLGEALLAPTRIYGFRKSARAASRRSRTSPAAGSSKTCRACSPKARTHASTQAHGRFPPRSRGSSMKATSPQEKWHARSTAASAWSPWSHRAMSKRRSARSLLRGKPHT